MTEKWPYPVLKLGWPGRSCISCCKSTYWKNCLTHAKQQFQLLLQTENTANTKFEQLVIFPSIFTSVVMAFTKSTVEYFSSSLSTSLSAKVMVYYLNLKTEVLPQWCPLLYLQCVASLSWTLTRHPASCLMASDRRLLPSCGYTFAPNSLSTRQPSASGPKGREHKHPAASTLRQDEQVNNQGTHTHEDTLTTHLNTHTHKLTPTCF